MARRKLKRIEKIILVGFISSALTLIVFWWQNKKDNRTFYIPRDFEGWVMITYEDENRDPLPMEEGIQQIHISDSGRAFTATPLEIGWRKDIFLWVEADGSHVPIPPVVDTDSGPYLHIHQHQYFSRSHMDIARGMLPETDTTLFDETEIKKFRSGMINYQPGRKTLEYFYVTKQPKSLLFNPPKNAQSEALESLESRSIPAK